MSDIENNSGAGTEHQDSGDSHEGGDQYGWGGGEGGQGQNVTGNDAVQQALKKFQFKDGDNVEEVEYKDWDAIQKDLQKSRAADRRFQEAARAKQETERKVQEFQKFMIAAKQNPERLLREMGIDPHQWAEQSLARKLQDQLMSPEEKARAQEQAELNHHREMQKRMQQQAQQQQLQAARQQQSQQLQAGVMQAMQEVGMPQDPELVTIMMLETAKMLYADRKNLMDTGAQRAPLSYRDALARTKSAYDRHITKMIQSMDGDKLYEYLGQDNIKKVRSADLARVKKAGVSRNNPGQSAQRNVPKATAYNEPRPTINEKEFRARLDAIKQDPRGR